MNHVADPEYQGRIFCFCVDFKNRLILIYVNIMLDFKVFDML